MTDLVRTLARLRARPAEALARLRARPAEALARLRARLAEALARLRARPAEALARLRARPAEALARRRVPLGFFVGAIAIWLARPTWRSLAAGAALACVGEAVRVWAAGHLEKGREVTTSGPYRWVRHPLYLGSSLMGIGFVVAASSLPVAILVLGYLVATLSAAMRSEERWLQERFGAAYDDYCAGRMRPTDRQFELSRVVANRELRAVMGLLVIIAVLALKAQ